MSDDDDDVGLSSREKMLKRHKREVKELQGKILQLKKSVNKDKKRKKEVQDEILKLEQNLKERHALEIAQLEQDVAVPITDEMKSLKICENENENAIQNGDDMVDDMDKSSKKISKAEKRRQKKADAARERESMIKEAEESNKFCARNVEVEKIKEILKERKLKMFEINPDGNCLYAALSHQLNTDTYSIQDLRSKTADYIRSKLDEFMPFITDPNTGDMLDQIQLEKYCDEIERTSAWGGQPELRALSQALQRRIEVLQAEGRPVIFGEEFPSEKGLILAYYRHYYGLGEHYNSVEPLTLVDEDA